MKEKSVYILQHRYPWTDQWNDYIFNKDLKNLDFLNELKDKPEHVLEMEYRIVKKENLNLKSLNKKTSFYNVLHINEGISKYVNNFYK